ncbi:hypothetical protein [Algoriella sp.]|uniref:hypothetical protein n=1 Tax=Algoriella sp. TaxID=1872434 RepID=UPI001B03021B|nr:hypothetical protein [Algoriella sp.]MBO6211933.1 hypothetical protein [Algoriella sp.]
MKKIIFLMMLAIASVSLTSCVNDDDGYYEVPNIVNTGQITYKNVTFPLRNAVVSDIEKADGGFYYSVVLSQYPVPRDGRLNGPYLYMEIFQRGDLLFNGNYITNSNDRGLDYIEYFENPMMLNNVPVTGSGTLEVYDNQFDSGNLFLENYFDGYDRSLLNSAFSIRDISGSTLTGNFNGLFLFNQKYDKSVSLMKADSSKVERVKTGKRRQVN